MRRASLLAIVAFLFASAACAEVFYMWTDADGQVHYSDRPPKNFNGPVKRIEVDDPDPGTHPGDAPRGRTPATVAAPKPPTNVQQSSEKTPVVSEIAAKRRAERERLQHDLDVAREKLATARKALADHDEPGEDERQMVQRPASSSKGGNTPGTVSASSRLNCRTQEKDGKKITLCPVSAPTEAYYDRVDKLEEEVRRAEEDLAAAERAYRRGVD